MPAIAFGLILIGVAVGWQAGVVVGYCRRDREWYRHLNLIPHRKGD